MKQVFFISTTFTENCKLSAKCKSCKSETLFWDQKPLSENTTLVPISNDCCEPRRFPYPCKYLNFLHNNWPGFAPPEYLNARNLCKIVLPETSPKFKSAPEIKFRLKLVKTLLTLEEIWICPMWNHPLKPLHILAPKSDGIMWYQIGHKNSDQHLKRTN